MNSKSRLYEKRNRMLRYVVLPTSKIIYQNKITGRYVSGKHRPECLNNTWQLYLGFGMIYRIFPGNLTRTFNDSVWVDRGRFCEAINRTDGDRADLTSWYLMLLVTWCSSLYWVTCYHVCDAWNPCSISCVNDDSRLCYCPLPPLDALKWFS